MNIYAYILNFCRIKALRITHQLLRNPLDNPSWQPKLLPLVPLDSNPTLTLHCAPTYSAKSERTIFKFQLSRCISLKVKPHVEYQKWERIAPTQDARPVKPTRLINCGQLQQQQQR